uniref:Uncharacterized protein n=1 Tax=Timema cristinae TaxID=61476 RepID=A0A7R9CAD6_TIMCR|nr:unnamed protein product [Timema cristinae]
MGPTDSDTKGWKTVIAAEGGNTGAAIYPPEFVPPIIPTPVNGRQYRDGGGGGKSSQRRISLISHTISQTPNFETFALRKLTSHDRIAIGFYSPASHRARQSLGIRELRLGAHQDMYYPHSVASFDATEILTRNRSLALCRLSSVWRQDSSVPVKVDRSSIAKLETLLINNGANHINLGPAHSACKSTFLRSKDTAMMGYSRLVRGICSADKWMPNLDRQDIVHFEKSLTYLRCQTSYVAMSLMHLPQIPPCPRQRLSWLVVKWGVYITVDLFRAEGSGSSIRNNKWLVSCPNWAAHYVLVEQDGVDFFLLEQRSSLGPRSSVLWTATASDLELDAETECSERAGLQCDQPKVRCGVKFPNLAKLLVHISKIRTFLRSGRQTGHMFQIRTVRTYASACTLDSCFLSSRTSNAEVIHPVFNVLGSLAPHKTSVLANYTPQRRICHYCKLESFNTRITAETLVKPSVEGLKLAKVAQRKPHEVEKNHCCLVKCENLQWGLKYFVGEWKIEGSTCYDSMKHDFIFEVLPNGTSLDVHFRNTLMELCEKNHWERYPLKKLWLKLGQMIADDADKISKYIGIPFLIIVKGECLSLITPYRGLVCGSTSCCRQTGSLDSGDYHITLERACKGPKTLGTQSTLKCLEEMQLAEDSCSSSHATIFCPLIRPLRRVAIDGVARPRRHLVGCSPFEGLLSAVVVWTGHHRWIQQYVHFPCGRDQKEQVNSVDAISPGVPLSDLVTTDDPQDTRNPRRVEAEDRVVKRVVIRVVAGIGWCSDWSRDLVASCKCNHGAEITLFISDPVVNHVRRDVVIKLRLEGIILEYSEATSGGKMT